MRPFIGVTCSADPDGRPIVRPPYIQALHEAGAIPVPLPFTASQEAAAADAELAEIFVRLDGMLLTGSEDLDSALWGEPLHPRADLMHPSRQATELAVCRAVLASDLPCLAICGGMQTLNVVAGGTVVQHVPDLGPHVLDHSVGVDGPHHAVRAAERTLTAHLLSSSFETNTAHHQALGRLGEGFIATAWAEDKIIEACEAPDRRFVLGVQWHPERMQDRTEQRALFHALVDACSPVATI
jgi:gamma-glutamyl-gamma-aminobutyrate hydrolase PuuD